MFFVFGVELWKVYSCVGLGVWFVGICIILRKVIFKL